MSLKVVTSLTDLRRMLAEEPRKPAFVPTMGALHAGHGQLIRHASGLGRPVVVSVFVNPLQFGPQEDLARYPRTLQNDLTMAEECGADIVWTPSPEDLTPPNLLVTVDPGAMAQGLCGAFRPGHFRGVATIVLKLFHCVDPAIAVFGWKDAQQLLILRRMVADLNLDVEVVGVDTVREPDGLAMSSRNRYLSPAIRQEAAGLGQSLLRAQAWALERGGQVLSRDLVGRVRADLEALPNRPEIQYVECVSMENLMALESTQPGQTLLAVAIRYPEARLIDNVRI